MIADIFSLKYKENINEQSSFYNQQATFIAEKQILQPLFLTLPPLYPKIAVKYVWICCNRKLNLNYSAENAAIASSAKNIMVFGAGNFLLTCFKEIKT